MNFEPDLGTPLPQRLFDRVGLERIPVFENAFAFQQILEARVSPWPSEKSFGLFAARRQSFCDKAQGETSSEIELVLMRDREVALRSFEILRKILVERVTGIGSPPDFTRIGRDLRVVLHRRCVADEVEGGGKLIVFDGDHDAALI